MRMFMNASVRSDARPQRGVGPQGRWVLGPGAGALGPDFPFGFYSPIVVDFLSVLVLRYARRVVA